MFVHSRLREKRRLEAITTHGKSSLVEYATWESMLQRCTNKNSQGYCLYGGRGIKVCKRWFKFENFYSDMGEKPIGLTLERIDNEKGYLPDNCKWATPLEQSHNRRIRSDNTSGVAGIYWEKRTSKWQVQICIKAKRISLGCFSDIKDAILARISGEKKYWRLYSPT